MIEFFKKLFEHRCDNTNFQFLENDISLNLIIYFCRGCGCIIETSVSEWKQLEAEGKFTKADKEKVRLFFGTKQQRDRVAYNINNGQDIKADSFVCKKCKNYYDGYCVLKLRKLPDEQINCPYKLECLVSCET